MVSALGANESVAPGPVRLPDKEWLQHQVLADIGTHPGKRLGLQIVAGTILVRSVSAQSSGMTLNRRGRVPGGTVVP
jgi:hypothetical protein